MAEYVNGKKYLNVETLTIDRGSVSDDDALSINGSGPYIGMRLTSSDPVGGPVVYLDFYDEDARIARIKHDADELYIGNNAEGGSISFATRPISGSITTRGEILATGDLSWNYDIYNIAMTNYYGSSDITGFTTTFYTTAIYYKRVGNLVFVTINLTGESNTTGFTFTLPFTNSNTAAIVAMGRVVNGGAWLSTPGNITINSNSNLATVYSSAATASWSNINAKGIFAQFFYEV